MELAPAYGRFARRTTSASANPVCDVAALAQGRFTDEVTAVLNGRRSIGSRASSSSTTFGRISYSTAIVLTASQASCGVSAATAAISSPS